MEREGGRGWSFCPTLWHCSGLFWERIKKYRADAMAGDGNSLLHQTEVTLFHRGKGKDFQDFAVSRALVHVLLSIITLQTGIRG